MAERLVGVDVGGTKVAVAVLEGSTLSEPAVQPTEVADEGALLDQLERGVREACDEPAAVGIAVPSVVDFANGAARYSVNIPLAGVPLRAELGERLGVPVYVDNDATCAALAEAHDDDGNLMTRHLVMLTVGTGVGGGIIIDGRVYRGATGAAAELGHTIIGLDLTDGAPPAEEEYPQPGSLEWLGTGGALAQLGEPHGFASGREVTAAALDGDERARRLVEILGERVGIGAANMLNAFDPEELVIGGGVASVGELLLDPIERVARRYALRGVGTATTIRLARYGNDAGVRGAALLAGQELAAERGDTPHDTPIGGRP
jgi:glucokinase